MKFQDRYDAGEKLCQKLAGYRDSENTLVLALPRGGVPVGYMLAKNLNLPLDVFVVRKLGAPFNPELAIGAIGPNGTVVLNEALMGQLKMSRVTLDQIIRKEQDELERRLRRFRDDLPFPDLSGKTVILVDDGVATGSTALAAIRALQGMHAEKIVMAVPVSSFEAASVLEHEADEFYALKIPVPFQAVGLWYENFEQTGDEEVIRLLQRDRRSESESGSVVR